MYALRARPSRQPRPGPAGPPRHGPDRPGRGRLNTSPQLSPIRCPARCRRRPTRAHAPRWQTRASQSARNGTGKRAWLRPGRHGRLADRASPLRVAPGAQPGHHRQTRSRRPRRTAGWRGRLPTSLATQTQPFNPLGRPATPCATPAGKRHPKGLPPRGQCCARRSRSTPHDDTPRCFVGPAEAAQGLSSAFLQISRPRGWLPLPERQRFVQTGERFLVRRRRARLLGGPHEYVVVSSGSAAAPA